MKALQNMSLNSYVGTLHVVHISCKVLLMGWSLWLAELKMTQLEYINCVPHLNGYILSFIFIYIYT